MRRSFHILALAALATLYTGCASTRNSTTQRTAVEMALISTALDNNLALLEANESLAGKSFYFNDAQYQALDEEYALSAIRLHLLQQGLRETTKAEEADFEVRPRSAFLAIDDFKFFIGIPSIPIIVPGAGTITTPELALFKRDKQIGRSRLGLYAVSNEDGALVHDYGVRGAQSYLTNWVILFLIKFRNTDLPEPYRTGRSLQ
jgi:hypothetical protein